MWAFFWMMAAVTIKYITRNDGVFAATWIESLYSLIREIERKVDGQPWRYTRGSHTELQTTRQKQIESVRELCRRMQEIKPKVTEFTGSEPLIPRAEIELLLSLAGQ
jgi:hypothetical protein